MPIRQRYLILSLALLLLLPPIAAAQSGPLICFASPGTPALVRAEGVAELVSDYVITCSGGVPGAAVPVNFNLYLSSTAATSRIVAPSKGLSEALLIVDELNGGTVAGVNIHQSLVSGNGIIFPNVPVSAPGASGTRTFRITNIRVDASVLAPAPGGEPPRIVGFLSLTGSMSVPLASPEQILGVAVRSTDFYLRNAGDSAVVPGIAFDQPGGMNPALAFSPAATGGALNYRLSFRQALPGAFKRRNAGTTAASPAALANQDTPGTDYGTESGFYSAALPPTDGLNQAGLATQGTRLVARFINVPAGVALYTTLRRIPSCCAAGGQNYPGEARRIDAAQGSYTEMPKTTSADLNGTQLDIAPVPLSGGSGTAVWEVLANPDRNDLTFDFGLVVAYTTPMAGAAAVTGGLGPASSSGLADSTSPVPRFSEWAMPADACAAGSCLSVSPRVLNLTYETGNLVHPSAAIAVAGTAGALPFSVTTASPYNWLSVNGGSFVTPGFISVGTDPSALPAGVYSGTITITTANALNSPQVVFVVLKVTAGPGVASPMRCSSQAAVPPLLRNEGVAELTSDIVLVCDGGNPGQVLQSTIQVSFNADVTSRILNPSTNASEALLLVDEPGTSVNPTLPLTVGSTVFQGVQTSPRTIVFSNVPVVTPAAGAIRILRIVNVRINAGQLPATNSFESKALATLSTAPFVTFGTAFWRTVFPIPDPLVVGFAQVGAAFSLRDSGDGASSTGIVFDQAGGSNVGLAASPTAAGGSVNYLLKFTEGFATAFKKKSEPDQGSPGVIYNTESGFFSAALPAANSLNQAGRADSGTRLMARFSQVPDGVKLYVTTALVRKRQDSSRSARLVATDVSGAGAYTEVAATSTVNYNGEAVGIAPVSLVAGSGQAVWEVTGPDSLVTDDYTFGVLVAYAAPVAANGVWPSGLLAPQTVTTSADPAAPLPRFWEPPPMQLSIVAGNPNSMTVGSQFVAPFSVRVRDALGNPVSGVVVAFTAPQSGPSASFPNGNTAVTDQGGVASIFPWANSVIGSYQVLASVPGAPAVAFEASNTALTLTGRITVGGAGLAGVTVALGGTGVASAVTDANGWYSFPNLPWGNYTITPSKANYAFTPPSATIAAWSSWVPGPAYFAASLAPSLGITSTHQGNFVQGQTGAVYILTVSNAPGAAPASGPVTVTETLPAGLTLISMQGAGWSCSANVCTCADGLNAGQTYPPITVTVNVSTNAALLTNTVSVSGGGAPTAVASDPTIITLTGSLPSTTLLFPVSGAFFGQQVALTAGVTSGATGTVAFYDGATILGVRAVTGGQAVLTTSLLPAGRRSLWARYHGDPTYAASNSVVLGVIVTPAAANGFGPPVTVSMGGYSAAVVVGDFDADGKPDLAAANYVANNLQVLLGLGNGAFQNPVFYAAGSAPWSIAAGDFNGDGKTDLVTANTNGNNVSVLLGNGNGTFQPALNYGVDSPNPKSVAVGDFNGDGKADLVTANSGGEGPNALSVLIGNGDGSFQPAAHSNGGLWPRSVVVGDFDGDGKADLAVSGTNLAIVIGNGNGTFQAPVTIDSTGNIATAVLGDFNADGKQDVAALAGLSWWASVLLGAGNGSLGAPVNYAPTPGGPSFSYGAIAVGDFNGDGKSDIAAANAADTVSLLLGLGDGTFQAGPRYPAQTPRALAVGDFNGDGRSDLAIAGDILTVMPGILSTADLTVSLVHTGSFGRGQTGGSYSITVRNAGPAPTVGAVSVNGTLPAGLSATAIGGAGWSCTLAALTCSRSDSLVFGAAYPAVKLTVSVAANAPATLSATSAVSGGGEGNTGNNTASDTTIILAGSGIALASSSNPSAVGQPVTLTAAVAAVATGKVTFYDGTAVLGTGTVAGGQASLTTRLLAPGTRSLRAHYAGDSAYAPGDASRSQTVSPAPAGAFRPATTYAGAGSGPYAVIAADFNGDGKVDLASANWGGNDMSVLIGGLNGAFQPAVHYVTGASPSALSAGDFNGDGNTDVVLANTNDSTVSVLLGYGTGTFQPAVNYAVGMHPFAVAVADINGDGNADIVTANSGANTVSVLLGTASGTWFQAAHYLVGLTPRALAVADFNTDGWPDLAVALGNGVSVMPGNGDGTFAAPVNYPLESGSWSITAGDFNGDGIPDLAYGVPAGPVYTAIAVRLGAGDGTFGPAAVCGRSSSLRAVTARDFDGDGRMDLAVAGGDPNVGWVASVLPGNGDGTFRPQVSYAVQSNPFDLAAADFDGDGRTDLAIANYGDNSISVMLGSWPGPFFRITKSHSGNFNQGQSSAEYTIWVRNTGSAPTVGLVTITEALPPGLTLVQMAGAGWTCASYTCTRSDVLGAGNSYAPITVTVNVAGNAASPQVNQAIVSGGGSPAATASDSTVIASGPPVLSVRKTHTGNFIPGQSGAVYTIMVSNAATARATSGGVTVTEAPPTGLTLAGMSGTGWTCGGAVCTRYDPLGPGASYPPITAVFNVGPAAHAPLVNQVTVSGGGSGTAKAADGVFGGTGRPANVAVFRAGAWYIDGNGNSQWEDAPADRIRYFGLPGDIPVLGDWDGSGTTKVGVFRNGTWYLDMNGNGVWDGPAIDRMGSFGLPGDTPVVGDWNGSGTAKVGVFRNGVWHLDLSGTAQWSAATDRTGSFGLPGDIPVVGDWNGSGSTKVGVFRSGEWHLDLSGTAQWAAATDRTGFFGRPGDTPVVGDWNGWGPVNVGVFRNGEWHLDLSGTAQWNPATDRVGSFGVPGDAPILGDWNGSGATKIGVFRNGAWYLDMNGNAQWDGLAIEWVGWLGLAGDTPVTGRWN